MATKFRRCESCYFYGMCMSNGGCSDYATLDEEREENDLIKRVDAGKNEYYHAWIEYISES